VEKEMCMILKVNALPYEAKNMMSGWEEKAENSKDAWEKILVSASNSRHQP